MKIKERKKTMSTPKKVAFFAVFAALAMIASYFERTIPLPIPVPGVRLGLANVVVLMVLYAMGEKEAFFVSVLRIFILGFLFFGLSSMLYSLAGGFLSFFAMVFGKRLKWFGVVGVSVIGGVFHNIGQILVAALVVSNMGLLYYVPVLMLAGVGAGVVTGVVAAYSLPYLNRGNHNLGF